MTGRTLLTSALIAAAALTACAVALLATSREAGAAFPGENGKLVFDYLYSFDGGPSGIYAVNTDRTGGQQITRNTDPDGMDTSPRVSPDGTRIVFGRYGYSSGDESCDVFAVDMDGSNPENLTDSSAECAGSPAWSSDGSKIVFEAGGALHTMDADGSEVRRIKGARPYPQDPTWSPDGSKIAFVSEGDVYAMDADGSNVERLTEDPSGDGSPDWSPDGSRIAFSSRRDPDPRGYGSAIYVMDADGSGERRVVTDITDDHPNYKVTVSGDHQPAWSPDGSKIAFMRSSDYETEWGDVFDGTAIRTMDADGQNLSDAYRGARFNYGPSWQPLGAGATRTTPNTTIISGPTGGSTAVFDFVSSRPGTSFECSLDGSPFQACEGSKRYDDLRAGKHRFAVRAKVPGGAWDPTPAERTWTVSSPDREKPTVTRPYPAPASKIRDRTPTVGATVRDAGADLVKSDIKLYLDGAAKTFSYDRATDRLSRTTGRLSYGRHRAKVVAEDGAGNVAAKTWTFRVVRGR